MIKYIGSKRRLVPVLARLCEAADARTALDLFTGTTRVAQAFKQAGAHVTAVDTARYSEVFSQCYIATDAGTVDHRELGDAIAAFNALPGEPGYFTDTFCVRSRFFQPENGARVDAVRDAIERDHAGSSLYPILLTSLLEAADRVDSTTGVQMAYVKQWAPRSYSPLTLRVPELIDGRPDGPCAATPRWLAPTLPAFDLAYLDPPYNQHRYFTNYHVWETLVAWDAPGALRRGLQADRRPRARTRKTAFNARRAMPGALRAGDSRTCRRASSSSRTTTNRGSRSTTCARCAAVHGHVEVLSFDSRRYVGAQIGIHNPKGERVGTVSHVRNQEYLVVAGDRREVERLTVAAGEVVAHA